MVPSCCFALHGVSSKNNLLKPIMHVHCIIDVNSLLTLEACLVNIGLALFCVYMDLDSVSYWPIANHLDLMHGQ